MASKHSARYATVKRWYDLGLWDKARVAKAMGHWITADEYKEITGEAYTGSDA